MTETTNTAPTTETIVPTTQEPTETTPSPQQDPFAPKFAALSKKEKALREKEKQIQAQLQEYNNYQNLLKEAKTNPLKFLEQTGLTYEEITNYILKNGAEPTIEDKFSELEKRILEKEKEFEAKELERQQKELELQEQYINNAINIYKDNLQSFAKENEKYELVNLTQSYDLAFDVVQDHFFKTGDILEPHLVLDLVEEYLEEQYKPLLNTKKFQPAKKEENTSFSSYIEKIQNKETIPSPTLSNSNTSTSYGGAHSNSFIHSREEAAQRAIAMLKAQRK